MVKTTVYLPVHLKRSLERLAAEQGRPEAELVRQAVSALVESSERPRPRGGLFSSGDETLSSNVDEALAGFGER
jgi:hypothetical protein